MDNVSKGFLRTGRRYTKVKVVMRRANRWRVVFGVAMIVVGIACVATPIHVVHASTTISQIGSDIDGEATNDYAGWSVAMSADGTRIAIGARYNDSSNNNNAGHVRVYSWNGTTWTQTGNDIDGEATNDNAGYSVAMSADGTRIAIGAPFNSDTGAISTGHVRVYAWNGTAWTQTGNDIDGDAAYDYLGWTVAMSADGTRIAIGAPNNDGTAQDAGRARIYDWNGATWTQTGNDIDGDAANDFVGWAVAMSARGTRIAISSLNNNGGRVRIYGLPATPTAPTISSLSATSGALTVSFTPGADGGAPITNYKYSVDGTNYIALNPATTSSPFTINGLTNGTTYSVTIKAVNSIGDSPASNALTGTPNVPAVAPTPTTSDSLPKTGNSSPITFVIGLLLAITGFAITRQRQPREQSYCNKSGSTNTRS